jgi:YfiR/HmsC-like
MTFRPVTIILLGMFFALRGPGQVIEEYQVKAAFLYNFGKFVEWPSQAFERPKDPITICVLGHNPFGNALDQVIRGKTIDGRGLWCAR